MRTLFTQFAVLILGSVLGYFVYPVLNAKTEAQAKYSVASQSVTSVQSFAQCDFTSEQIDRLADRIAPQFIARLSKAGATTESAEIKNKNPEEDLAANKKLKTEQQTAYSQANQIVDQMILNRRVTSTGMSEAVKLLQQSGQSDQAFKLMTRISAAVNNGELTLEQAGMAPSSSTQPH